MCGGSPRGTGKCFWELYARLAGAHSEWRVTLYHRNVNRMNELPAGNLKARRIEMLGDRWGIWRRVRLPLAAWIGRADVLHCPANIGPGVSLVPTLLTIHDLIPLQEEFRSSRTLRWGAAVSHAARKARCITTPSQYSKRQIVEVMGIPEEKIVVHPWGPNPNCRPAAEGSEVNRARAVCGMEADRPYVMALGGEDPRKNTRRILKAWALLTSSRMRDAALLVIGMHDAMINHLAREFAEMVDAGRCILMGYLSEDDMTVLMSGAEIVCFPSLSEGFGLPVLDAFASHTAVLTSRETSIPEVAGDAAYYVDPRSEDSIARGLKELLRDDALRAALVVAGTNRLPQFTWEHCTQQFCRAIEACLP